MWSRTWRPSHPAKNKNTQALYVDFVHLFQQLYGGVQLVDMATPLCISKKISLYLLVKNKRQTQMLKKEKEHK